jgi:hypothetical protein
MEGKREVVRDGERVEALKGCAVGLEEGHDGGCGLRKRHSPLQGTLQRAG